MKQLDTKFRQKGFTLEQVKREGNMAIYKRWKEGQQPHYELIYITSHNGYEIGGNVIPPSEVYPNDNMWGMYGWTYKELETALNALPVKLADINKENKEKDKAKKERSEAPDKYLTVKCPITKASRKAPVAYLEKKAKKLKTDVQTIVRYYLSREGLKQLNHGKADHPEKKLLIKYNGKS